MSGRLILVATPIGNLGDLTPRAREVLATADWIAAEDTRHTGRLLKHFEIATPQISLHKFNEASRTAEILSRIETGKRVALVSDAGMPGLCDPGERLVRSCLNAGLEVEVIPGVSAVQHAVVASGFPTVPYYFGGFLPVKKGRRGKELAMALSRECTSVYFESPHRLLGSLEILKSLASDRPVCVARELTKKFEEVIRGLPGEVSAHFEAKKVKGEICLVISAAHGPLTLSGPCG